ncbi:MAG: SAM-dependent methyltransferase [Robiginitomaculum sp.]|nr:MAG: SAM-dependent methyltransferase [Robiginitomaculum sp.]
MNDKRLDFPSTRRNADPIAQVLKSVLPNTPCMVLEIAAGSGQHGVHFCHEIPNLIWWPTDIDPDHIVSINAWRAHKGMTDQIHEAQRLNVCSAPWQEGIKQKSWPPAFDAIININMIHISPWEATLGLLKGAAQHLRSGGVMMLYGPYKIDGKNTAPSNADFDVSLRSRNQDWGVRNLDEVAAAGRAQGLALRTTIPMPANNFSLVFERV